MNNSAICRILGRWGPVLIPSSFWWVGVSFTILSVSFGMLLLISIASHKKLVALEDVESGCYFSLL